MAINNVKAEESQTSCCSSQYVCRRSAQPQRFAPYPAPSQRKGGAAPQAQQELSAGAVAQARGAERRKVLLQLAIRLANTSLEATLASFQAACAADAGSPAALAALDAAEVAMAQTSRMTTLASALAAGLLQGSSPAQGGNGCADGQPADGACRQEQQQRMLAMLQQQLAGMAADRRQLLQQPHMMEEEEVEDGEEVSSRCQTLVSNSSNSNSTSNNGSIALQGGCS